jgi:hypothetical protein
MLLCIRLIANKDLLDFLGHKGSSWRHLTSQKGDFEHQTNSQHLRPLLPRSASL